MTSLSASSEFLRETGRAVAGACSSPLLEVGQVGWLDSMEDIFAAGLGSVIPATGPTAGGEGGGAASTWVVFLCPGGALPCLFTVIGAGALTRWAKLLPSSFLTEPIILMVHRGGL